MKLLAAAALFLIAFAAKAAPFPENLTFIYVWDQDGNAQVYDAVFVAVEIFDCGPGTDDPLDTYEVRVPETGIMLLHMAAGTVNDVRVRYDQRNYNTNYAGTGMDVLHVYTVPDELVTRQGFEAERCKRHWR